MIIIKKDSLIEEGYNYIFEAKPYIDNYNLEYIASIQKFYSENGYFLEEHVEDFLNYFMIEVRKKVSLPFNPETCSYKGRCARVQQILTEVFTRMNLVSYGFNIGRMFTEDNLIHQVGIVILPVLINGEVVNKPYVLDPSFRQFCIDEENRIERYDEEPRYSVKMSSPHPGYFLNLTEKGKKFANTLIKKGYFELTDDNIKTYFDSFVLYLTPKESYQDKSLVGKIATTNYTSADYRKLMKQSVDKEMTIPRKDELISTPLEKYKKEKMNIFSKIKGLFQRDELDLSEVEIPNSIHHKK